MENKLSNSTHPAPQGVGAGAPTIPGGSNGKDRNKERTYVNENQQALMKVLEYLAQDILVPKTQKEVSEALGLSRDVTFRTLWNLQDREWVEECADGYRLSPKMTFISDRLRLSVADTLRKYLPQEGQR